VQVGVPRETFAGEKRVAATPDSVTRLQKLGFTVAIERDAGRLAGFSDELYAAAGAAVVDDVWPKSDIVLKVRAPASDEVAKMHKGQVLISFLQPAQNKDLVEKLKDAGVTAIAVDQIPRITRAQKMDALSSMANIAGYRAVIEAANAFPRLFSGQITAAGKMPPAKVLIIGAGVAGLAAIGAARGLGAVVRAFDTRAAVREQIQSMGAEFIEVTGVVESGEGQGGYAKEMSQAFIDAEMALFRAQAKEVDIVVTTALIPGRPAPKLWLKDMVESMRPGSVVVDLAAEQGGNCDLTKPGEAVVHNAVTVIGYTDLTSRMAAQAAQLYGTNLAHLLDDMTRPKDGGERNFRVDFDDEVVRAATVTKDGVVTWPPPKKDVAHTAPPVNNASDAPKYPAAPVATATTVATTAASAVPATTTTTTTTATPAHRKAASHGAPAGAPSSVPLIIAGVMLLGMGFAAPPAFLSHLIVFVLACFIGYQVIWNVTPALHTPLMSVTNAISGIILVGGLLHASDGFGGHVASTVLGGAAILIATINIAGGFLVTQRMLKMFRRGDS
jgi:NAD(P) transhydrogenase subunit alpha